MRRIYRKIKRTLKPEVVPFFTRDIFSKQILEKGWTVGPWSYGAPIIIPSDVAKLHIGSYCSFASPTTVILGNHDYLHASTYPFHNLTQKGPIFPKPFPDLHQASNGDVVIGNDVWVGRDSTIVSGVRIGDGAVIAASAVVTHDVPSYAIVAGVPAKVIKFRFSPELVERLNALKWWALPEDFIQQNKDLFQLHPEQFLADIQLRYKNWLTQNHQ